MNKLSKLSKILVLCVCFLLPVMTFAGSPETQEKLNDALTSWRTYDAEKLTLPSNEDLKQELLKRADSDFAAHVILIRMGDEKIIKNSIDRYLNYSLKNRGPSCSELYLAANPVIIPALIDSLMVEESGQAYCRGEIYIIPKSVVSGYFIKEIVKTSNKFSPSVRAWAKGLPKVDEEIRAAIRTWCQINRDALIKGDYAACIPVTNATAPMFPRTLGVRFSPQRR
jgi:hypothetical protein